MVRKLGSTCCHCVLDHDLRWAAGEGTEVMVVFQVQDQKNKCVQVTLKKSGKYSAYLRLKLLWTCLSLQPSLIGCWRRARLPAIPQSDGRRWRSCRAAPERYAARWAPSCHTEQQEVTELMWEIMNRETIMRILYWGSTHSDAPPLQLLEDLVDVDGEAEWELAASLLRVGGRDDADVRFVRLRRVFGVILLDQVLQVTRQQDGLPAQRLHVGHVEHLEEWDSTEVKLTIHFCCFFSISLLFFFFPRKKYVFPLEDFFFEKTKIFSWKNKIVFFCLFVFMWRTLLVSSPCRSTSRQSYIFLEKKKSPGKNYLFLKMEIIGMIFWLVD